MAVSVEGVIKQYRKSVVHAVECPADVKEVENVRAGDDELTVFFGVRRQEPQPVRRFVLPDDTAKLIRPGRNEIDTAVENVVACHPVQQDISSGQDARGQSVGPAQRRQFGFRAKTLRERQYSVRFGIPAFFGEKAQVRIQRNFVPLGLHAQAQAHAHIRLGQRRGQRTPAARFQPADTDVGKRAVDPKCQIAADPVVALEYLVQVFSPLEAEFPGQRIVRRYAGIVQHELQPLAAGLHTFSMICDSVVVHTFDVENFHPFVPDITAEKDTERPATQTLTLLPHGYRRDAPVLQLT